MFYRILTDICGFVHEMFYHCFTDWRNVLPNWLNQEESECDVLLFGSLKRGMTPRRLHTVTPKVSGKGAKKKAEMILSLADMGTLN